MTGITSPVPQSRTEGMTLQTMQKIGSEDKNELSAERESSEKSFVADVTRGANTILQRVTKNAKSTKSMLRRVDRKSESSEKAQKVVTGVERGKEGEREAQEFEDQNPELKADTLVLLLNDMLKEGDSPEDIIKKVRDLYRDVSLADETLNFLLKTTKEDTPLHQNIMKAKEILNENFGREIVAGKNIRTQAWQASQNGLGEPTSLRDLYRNVTDQQPDSHALFKELTKKYAFKDMQKVIKFLMHSLGADLKSPGPSIDRGQLHVLFQEARTLQAILGVYRFFRGRSPLVKKMFAKASLEIPSKLTFETMSKEFMQLASERYPSATKALEMTARLGIDKWLIAKIIVLTQMRDGVKEVSMGKIYKSLQHRDEMYLALLEVLEDLEDELSELEDEKERENPQQTKARA